MGARKTPPRECPVFALRSAFDEPLATGEERHGTTPVLPRYFYFGKFSFNRGNDSGVLGLSGTPRQSIPRVSGVRNGIFSGTS
jgi:hypothetical protein